MVHRYLASYRAAPQKTTGKSPYELMFNRKMMTKLPQLQILPNKKLDQEVRERHDGAKHKQKECADNRRRAKEKIIKVGDKVLAQQKKSTVKTPWDPVPFKVTKIIGSKLRVEKDELVRERVKSNMKVLKPRPEELRIKKSRGRWWWTLISTWIWRRSG